MERDQLKKTLCAYTMPLHCLPIFDAIPLSAPLDDENIIRYNQSIKYYYPLCVATWHGSSNLVQILKRSLATASVTHHPLPPRPTVSLVHGTSLKCIISYTINDASRKVYQSQCNCCKPSVNKNEQAHILL